MDQLRLCRPQVCSSYRYVLALLAGVAVSVGGCSTGNQGVTDAGLMQGQGRFIPTSADGDDRATSLEQVYRLRSGDKLRVTIFGEEDLSGEFEVNVYGAVALPLVGEVKAQDLSLQEFRDTATRAFAKGYLKEPRVSVQVMNYRPFFVQGEVRQGGQFDYRTGLTIRDAIAMAGGYTYRAVQNHIVLVRDGTNGEIKLRTPSNALVLPGDNISVPERFF